MKCYKNGKYVKNIPVKFRNLVHDYEFENKKKRLSVKERDDLEKLLVISKVKSFFDLAKNNHQITFARDYVKQLDINNIRCMIVSRFKNNTEFRIGSKNDSIMIRVPYNVICDFPDNLVEHINE